MAKIDVNGVAVTVVKVNSEDYISLTDMMRSKDGEFFFHNWLRNRNTVEFLGTWEKVYNPEFNSAEFDIIKSKAGLNNFRLSAKEWTEKTHAIGIVSKAGRYGGTYAHKDIAFEFAMWISPEFKVYLIREFQRLKEEEQKLIGWTAKRELSKVNYRIHTDAIKQNLIPAEVSERQISFIYANEANPDLKGNIRDYATINQLICLSNMESLNAIFINEGLPQAERLRRLNAIAIHQMTVLEGSETDRKLLK